MYNLRYTVRDPVVLTDMTAHSLLGCADALAARLQCTSCNEFGHNAALCGYMTKAVAPSSRTDASTNGNGNGNVVCYQCGKRGHRRAQCRSTGIPTASRGGRGCGVAK